MRGEGKENLEGIKRSQAPVDMIKRVVLKLLRFGG